MKEVNFELLTLYEKGFLIHTAGQQLASVVFTGYIAFLYNLGYNYVEVYVNTTTKQIDAIKTADYNDLEKYLTEIDVYDLI